MALSLRAVPALGRRAAIFLFTFQRSFFVRSAAISAAASYAFLCPADCLLLAHDFMLTITDRGISRRRPGETPLFEAEPTNQQ